MDIRGVVVIDGIEKIRWCSYLPVQKIPRIKYGKKKPNGLKSYDGGIYSLRFVRQSLARLGGMLTQRDKEVDQDLLRDVFFVERPPESYAHLAKFEGSNRRQSQGKPMGDFPDVNGRTQPVLMQAIQDGVEIRERSCGSPRRRG